MKNENDRLSELVGLDRAETRDGPRTEGGWARLQAAVSAGVEVGPDLSTEKLLRVSRLGHTMRRVLLYSIGAVIVAGAGSFWLHSGRRGSAPVVAISTSHRMLVDEALHEAPADGTGQGGALQVLDILAHEPKAAAASSSSGVAAPNDAAFAAESFEKELALIKAAKLELDQGHTKATLSLVRQHARSYPKGVFAGEREALRLLATCENLAPMQRQKLASEFARTHPNSPYIDRVRHVCSNAAEKIGP